MKTNEMIERIDLALLNGEEVPEWLLTEYKKVREAECTRPYPRLFQKRTSPDESLLQAQLKTITDEEWKTKSINQIADKLGCCTTTVGRFRLDKFGAHSRLVFRKNNKSKLDDVRRKWDWTKTDTQLSGMKGLSRERIRQMRERLGMPPSPDIHRRTTQLSYIDKAREFLKTLPQGQRTMIVSDAAAMAGVARDVMRRAAAELGFEFRSQYNRCVELENANFNLPNNVLGEIWGRSPFIIANLRSRYNKGFSKWRKFEDTIRCCPGSTITQYYEALDAEKKKRAELKP